MDTARDYLQRRLRAFPLRKRLFVVGDLPQDVSSHPSGAFQCPQRRLG